MIYTFHACSDRKWLSSHLLKLFDDYAFVVEEDSSYDLPTFHLIYHYFHITLVIKNLPVVLQCGYDTFPRIAFV
jgi:hypothetical protein